MIPRLLLATLLAAAPALADLRQAKDEPNLGKRSVLALDNASEALAAAREAYAKGQNDRVEACAKEIQESVSLAEASLRDTGKNPRKNPKYFKRAETSTRDLLRRLEGLQQSMDITDRPLLDAAKAKVQQVHDDLLVGVLEGTQK